MPRWLRWTALIVVLLLVIFVGGPAIVCARLWSDGNALIAANERAGVLDPHISNAPLTPVETTFAIASFADGWNERTAPCRALVSTWRLIAGQAPLRSARVSLLVPRYLSGPFANTRSIQTEMLEGIVGCQLEQRYSDRQLLRFLLSHEYFGEHVFGLEAAARHHFGVAPDNLTPLQVAKLAALPNSPSAYTQDPERWNARAELLAAKVAAYHGQSL